MELPLIDDYQRLFLENTPLLDVRAPVEFEQGAFPEAINIPLINNDEREAIGIRYKESGQKKAIELGHELVTGDIKEHRVDDWATFIQQHPNGALYCFRGGMRSKIAQQWIYERTGIAYPRIKGGYKLLRRYLLEQLDVAASEIKPIVLSGRTGSGKTLLLQRLQDKIDLEHLYHHRGSAFGKHVTPQPSQIDIENALSAELLKHRHHQQLNIVFEDESRSIGSRRVPDNIFEAMSQAPLIILEIPLDTRANNIFQEYVVEALSEYQAALGNETGFNTWANNLLTALDNIQRRLGGLHYRDIHSIMTYAIGRHRDSGETDHHHTWIHNLLAGYYDPMYDYQLGKKSDRVVFRGDFDATIEFLSRHYNIK